MRLWRSVRDRIIGEVKALVGAGDSILVVGYSQGAALATLAYEDIRWQLPRVDVSAHVFGSPRVLWAPSPVIQMRFPALHRHSARGDIVTMLPPTWLGFAHVGHDGTFGPCRWPTVKAHWPEYYLANIDNM